MSKGRHIRPEAHTESEWFRALMDLARFLRSPDGCPWDREQNAADFARFLGDELKEYRDALTAHDVEHVEEEFGDTLFCLLASAAAAEERGEFDLKRALRRIHEKMIRRHGHVFGEHQATSPEEVKALWESIKKQEKED